MVSKNNKVTPLLGITNVQLFLPKYTNHISIISHNNGSIKLCGYIRCSVSLAYDWTFNSQHTKELLFSYTSKVPTNSSRVPIERHALKQLSESDFKNLECIRSRTKLQNKALNHFKSYTSVNSLKTILLFLKEIQGLKILKLLFNYSYNNWILIFKFVNKIKMRICQELEYSRIKYICDFINLQDMCEVFLEGH
ncbi:hypothetical protein AGLY_014855 [Aphis glycines]|uniref:Uncharacterized protein n=1 Tax=Aphis glycines TaxID=307491 RepID=A0A6G0T384_APHGL|nr:hypothetical protein AGLY_014855 [Aphis glycines]